MTMLDEWPDVWSEYRRVFEYFDLKEADAAGVVFTVAHHMHQPDIDRVADALKEFSVRAWERDIPDDQLKAELGSVKGEILPTIEGMDRAATLFGTPAEDLGIEALRLLADLIAPDEQKGA